MREPTYVRAIYYEAEEGGYWAEVPSIPGCATQGETLEELEENLRDAIVACLSVDFDISSDKGTGHALSVPV